MAENKGIFEFGDKFGYESPFVDWLPKQVSKELEKSLTISYVKSFIKGEEYIVTFTVVAKNLVQKNCTISVLESDLVFDDFIIKQSFKLKEGNNELLMKIPLKLIEAQKSWWEFGQIEFVAKLECDGLTSKTEEFILSQERNENVSFHIYANRTIEKHIPKNYNEKTKKGKIDYYYYDKLNQRYDIVTVDFGFTKKRKNGNTKIPQVLPKDYIKTYPYPIGGDAKTAYVCENGDIYVEGTEEGAKKYGIIKYPVDKGEVQLIKMPDSLSIIENTFKIIYSFRQSQRRYSDPETFAGFIGVLAEISKEVKCTGMCFEDATSYPSVSHPNGDSADTAYFSTLEEEQKKVDAFFYFKFKDILRGKTSWYDKLQNSEFHVRHEDHLHAGNFITNSIKIIKEK